MMAAEVRCTNLPRGSSIDFAQRLLDAIDQRVAPGWTLTARTMNRWGAEPTK
jgi:hypothetical protein